MLPWGGDGMSNFVKRHQASETLPELAGAEMHAAYNLMNRFIGSWDARCEMRT